MFLEQLLARNPGLVRAAGQLAVSQQIPPNTFVLDLDAIRANGRAIRSAAEEHGMSLYWMLKQVGRNPLVAGALAAPGSAETVSVDAACAHSLLDNGFRLGHIGNLVQIARADLPRLLAARPEVVSVFSTAMAREVGRVAAGLGFDQQVLLRVAHPARDTYLPGMEAGFLLSELTEVVPAIQRIEGVDIAGVTSFPTISYAELGAPRPTGNFATIDEAAALLRSLGVDVRQVNAPGNTCSLTVPLQAAGGATHIEPGHGFLGMTPFHLQFPDQPEVPAACYVSEVAHHFDGRAYVYGGGFFVDDPSWVEPGARRHALVGRDVDELLERRVPYLGNGAASGGTFGGIDYYAFLDADDVVAPVGSTVIFGFRMQSFVTRANVAVIEHVDGQPRLCGLFDQFGKQVRWYD
jgi:predicted amino acid racemase